MKKSILFMLIGLSLLVMPIRAHINLLHEFSGTDGAYPKGSLVLSGTTLYGMSYQGGSSNRGTIFKIQTNGSGFSLLHEFTGGAADGYYPYGDLLLSGSVLYGMTYFGGVSNNGTIFKIDTDGSDFALLHSFAGGTDDGANPEGSLIISGTTLYGMTSAGGTTNNKGTIFKIGIAGTGFSLLRKFAGGADDGDFPVGSLILSGTTLYGTTRGGGDSGRGTVFKIATAGTGFTLLHEFAGGVNDGRFPNGNLILSGTTLYGTANYGGIGENGVLFKLGTTGSDFALLHKFAGGVDDGAWPLGSLILSGTNLYGMTFWGGVGNKGTAFKIGTAGTGFELLHKFAGDADDGENPYGSLIISGSTLYGMTYGGGDGDYGVIFSLVLPSITVTSPNGGELWVAGSVNAISWISTGTIANVNIDYSINTGSSWLPVAAGTANDGNYAWTVPTSPSSTCLVRISDAANAATLDASDTVFTILPAGSEIVSAPSRPAGANAGMKAASYPFTTGGSTSNLGHTVQYRFDWDDGTTSAWLASGTTSASHSWAANGVYDVRAMARCVTHTGVESLWSNTHAITISDSGTLGKYNSPAQRKVLPEVIWAAATGGGTWMSEVQVTDLSGGSIVSVYYNTAAGRRGPFVLWNNGGGALRSQKYSNMLETIDGLDSGVFTYYGTVGAVEFVSQNAAHVLQATARTLNGSYSKTFPAFSVHDSNTADTTRVMSITNLTSNSTYRSTVGMFNPSADALTVELRLRNYVNGQIGSTMTKTLNGYGFTAFSPFTDAGVAYPANSFDNVILEVRPVSGTGKVLCFGASANNVTNDPAAHIAVQNGSAHDNGPSSVQILPEGIWAAASGGGTWMSEVQIVDMSGGSAVTVHFDFGDGEWRGPIVLWTGGGAGSKVKYANILQQLGTIDGGFTYYGRVGALEFRTQDGSHFIQVTARTLNGNYSKTFPGLNLVEAETADADRMMLIQNYASNSTYRSTCGFFNPTEDAVTVEFTLLNASGAQIGTPFSKTFSSWDFQAFNPFNEAGVPYPANSFDNVILRVRPTSGAGRVVCFGASANNASNDPAAHLAVQGQ